MNPLRVTSTSTSAVPDLSVLIATYRPEGIERVAAMDVPEVEGIHYWVSWQEHGDAPVPPELVQRNDFTIFRFDRRGQSANRNNLLEHASGRIFLIADDDLTYSESQLKAVIRAFSLRPDMDVATFMYEGAHHKTYPTCECNLKKLPRGFTVGGIEIAFRTSDRTKSLRFDELWGIGAPVLASSEDEIFMLDARRRGLHCRFIPIVITSHPHQSTGTRAITNPGVLMASGAYILVEYPFSAIFRLPLKAYRLHKNQQVGFFQALKGLLRGVGYAIRTPQVRKRILFRK